MAELSLTCPKSTTATSAAATGVNVARKFLCRTGGQVPSNTAIDINDPGSGWITIGDEVTFSGASDFVELTQVYRGGQLLAAAETASDNLDVYFVATSGTIAFEDILHRNDVIQVWRFDPTTSG